MGLSRKAESTGGILSGFDREHLLEKDIQLAPTPRERAFIQKFYLYLNMTKPKEHLILSYSRVDSEGKAIRPSYLTDRSKNVSTDQKYRKHLTAV